MAQSSRRNAVIVVLIVLLLLLLLLLVRCNRASPPVPPAASVDQPLAPAAVPAAVSTSAPGTPAPAEVLSPATITAPTDVAAGAVFAATWTGPNNPGDYLTLVPKDSPDHTTGNYTLTREGPTLKLTAPIEAGPYEVRYVATRSHTVLGRTPVNVLAIAATLSAPAEVWLDSPVTVSWTGPDNPGDYITLVAADAPDGRYVNYTQTSSGSPLTVKAPVATGAGELRYMTGQGGKVLGRRAIQIITPPVTLSAETEAIAGSSIPVQWTGPGNSGDYITAVATSTPDGEYGNYATLGSEPTVRLTLPMTPGAAELRYMTGRGAKVLGRRPIRIVAAKITLTAPDKATAGANFSVNWTGPANSGDYVTIVAAGTPDGQYGNYRMASGTAPLVLTAPKQAGPAELRYMSGQGALVLARRPILITE